MSPPQVTSYLPLEWAGEPPTLTLDNSWPEERDGVIEPGKSYYVSWSSKFIGRVTVRPAAAGGGVGTVTVSP